MNNREKNRLEINKQNLRDYGTLKKDPTFVLSEYEKKRKTGFKENLKK